MQIQRPLRACLLSLLGYNALVREVEKQRAEQFDVNRDEHLMKLQEVALCVQSSCAKHFSSSAMVFARAEHSLPGQHGQALAGSRLPGWRLLEPVISSFICAQGENPATDFRGMGVLGLDQLIYLLRKHNKAAHSLLSLSHHPTIGCVKFVVDGLREP